MKIMVLAIVLLLGGCAIAPEADYVGCGPRTLFWAVGPQAGEQFLDVCYTEMDSTEISKYFDFVPINGVNKDTRQRMDNNRDGLSGNGRLLRTKNRIRWGGSSCKQYARRISQQGCNQLGDMLRTGGCEWLALQVKPKPGITEAYVSFTPVSRVRKPDGQEYINQHRTFTTGFVNCK